VRLIAYGISAADTTRDATTSGWGGWATRIRAAAATPITVPAPYCSARVNTEPKSGLSTIATARITQ
jgi:hypothetical protein